MLKVSKLRIPYWLPVILILALDGCASSPVRDSPAGSSQQANENYATPPFYQIDRGRGASLLIMGTVHVGPPGGWQFHEAVRQSLEEADRFVLEVDLRATNEEEIGSLLVKLVGVETGSSLRELVSPETAKLLDEKDPLLTQLGLPRDARRWNKPWYLAIQLSQIAATQSGYDVSASADGVILSAVGPPIETVVGSGSVSRPLIALETIEEQLRFFDDLSPQLQDLMLSDTLSRMETAPEDVRELVAAWQKGDEESLERLAHDGIDKVPELEPFFDLLLRQRNLRWMKTFHTLLDQPQYRGETILVGVGAFHLVGETGLLNLFREANYRVRKIDQSN